MSTYAWVLVFIVFMLVSFVLGFICGTESNHHDDDD
jgi:hypothetical protein